MEGDSDYPSLSSCFICYICGDFFRRPRILPCGHSFCSECLDKLRDEIINEGKPADQGDVTNNHISYTSTVSTKLSPENPPESPLRRHDTTCNGNGKTKERSPVRKISSSCVDDVDSIMCQSYPPSSMIDPWSMSSSSTSPVINKTPNHTSEPKTKRVQTRETSPTNKPRKQKERGPSINMIQNIPTQRPCSQCGSILPSQRDSPLINKSSPCREQSPSCNARDNQPRWDTSSPSKSQNRKSGAFLQPPACSFEHKHGREMEQFVCPIPQCNYSMRVMNLARWSPRNKTVANALAAWRRQTSNLQDFSTQTDITNSQSVLVTIPRSIVDHSSYPMMPLGRKRHSSMIDIAMNQAVSVDGVQEPRYLPRGHHTWKSYAAMVGMNILQQILNI